MPIANRPKLTPYWQSKCGRAVVYLGDCRDVIKKMETDQFHAVVMDPPYGLEFMGKEWDAPWKNSGNIETCDEGTDVSHPERDGTQRVVYGNRTNARQRRAGEMDDPIKAKYLRHNVEYVRDSHLYQEWFNKCAGSILRVARPGAHLLSFGGTRMWHRMACAIEDAGFDVRDTIMWVYGSGFPKSMDISKQIDKVMGAERVEEGVRKGKPVTDAAAQWDGWGTALKPAVEPIIVARKTMQGTAAENTLEYGCGGMNIDGCRVGTDPMPVTASDGTIVSENTSMAAPNTGRVIMGTKVGRWPANLIHDGSEEVTNLFPNSSSSQREVTSKPGTVNGAGNGLPSHTGVYGFNDSGSAARFFYTAKADADDRWHMSDSEVIHPTVKPLDLMRYLVRLVCARGGTVLDPFMGSGSTGVAAVEEGAYFVGIEQCEDYAKIAVDRLKAALGQHPLVARLESEKVVVKYVPPPTRRLR